MINNKLRTLFLTALTALVLTACGGQSSDSGQSAKANDAADTQSAASSDLDKFAGKNICGILDKKALASLFSPQTDVETKSRVSRRGASCTWTWDRPDAEERKQAMIKAMMERMKPGSKGKKPKMSAYSLDYSVRVELQQTSSTAKNFVPRKLSESELQEQIAEINKRTQERLTDKQKQVAKKSGIGGMAGRLLRKANEREVVAGVGDAAYWVPVSNGSLRVLHGNKAIVISSSIADDQKASLDVAKKIYAAITQ